MNASLKNIFSSAFYTAAILCSVLLAVSNLAVWAAPDKYWAIALLGIAFPLLVIFTAIFLIIFFLTKRKRAIMPGIALLLSIPNISSSIAYSPFTTFNNGRQANSLRVLTWNTGLMNYSAADSNEAIKYNAIILQKIRQSDADVLCLQEFFTAVIPGNHYNFIDSIAATMQYPYHYFSRDYAKFEGNFYSGSIILSRFPIADTEKVFYPKPFSGSIIRAGILMGKDTVDVFTTRLQSVHFGRSEYQELGNIRNGKDSAFAGSKNIIKKLRLGYSQRANQVNIAKTFLNSSKRPLIFTGDFNDVPVSFTYHQLGKNLQDAWIKKGNGPGRTFVYLSPTLRIDNIFFNDRFKALQVKRIFADGASDHHAVLADFELWK